MYPFDACFVLHERCELARRDDLHVAHLPDHQQVVVSRHEAIYLSNVFRGW